MSLLDEVKEFIHRYNIRPRRVLGQNFCVDSDLMKRMVGYGNIESNDVVLEIGSGFGFLTRVLSEAAGNVIAVERDPRLVKVLREELVDRKNVEVIEGDILKVKLEKFNKIVANPPYSISSPLMLRLLRWSFDEAILTLQVDFVSRLVTRKMDRNYGRLAVMMYYKSDLQVLEYVPRSSFYPLPRVESRVIKILHREAPFEVIDEDFFLDFINYVFTLKKRKIRNAILAFIQKRLVISKREATSLVQGIPFVNTRVYELTPEELGVVSNDIYRKLVKRITKKNACLES